METKIYITIEKPASEGESAKPVRYAVNEKTFSRISEILAVAGEPVELPTAAVPQFGTTEQLMTAMIPMLTGRSKTIIYDMSEKPEDKEFSEVLAIYQNFNFVCVDGKGKERLNTTVAAF